MDYLSLYKQALDVLQKVFDIILPPRCPLTGDNVDDQGMLSADAWVSLNFIAAPYCKCCGMPFIFDRQGEDNNGAQSDELCMKCLEKAPPYNSARAALVYNDHSRPLILGFKHGDKTHFIRNFLPWLHSAGRNFLLDADAIIPVPLHHTRLIARRYNQAAIMAKYLEKTTEKPAIIDALLRTRATPPQGHLTIDQRQKNVSKAFTLKKKYENQIKDKKIVLVDDVYTTGATVNECTKVLKSGGAQEVHILTIARVVKDEY